MVAGAARRVDLAIFDDMLPTSFSPFRTLEYAHHLAFFDAILLSSERWRPFVKGGDFDDHLASLPIDPALKPKVLRLDGNRGIAARLAYVTFLDNARRHLDFFERREIPFILQLYPGGGFRLDFERSDRELERVLASPMCRRVIVTQRVVRDYLTDKFDVAPERLELIYGGVFDSKVDFDFFRDKQRFGSGKDTLDLCFVAHKYVAGDFGSKGYDQFVAIAPRLAADFPQLRFHVVGGYEREDLPLGDLGERFTFYGRRDSGFFAGFYPGMDIILSINRAFHTPGIFDGFPTGACIEAGLRGALNCVSDPLGMNVAFTDDRDIVLVDFDRDRTATRLSGLLNDPARLYDLAYANWRRYRTVFDLDTQLMARARVIAEILISEGREIRRQAATIARLRKRVAEMKAPKQAKPKQGRLAGLFGGRRSDAARKRGRKPAPEATGAH